MEQQFRSSRGQALNFLVFSLKQSPQPFLHYMKDSPNNFCPISFGTPPVFFWFCGQSHFVLPAVERTKAREGRDVLGVPPATQPLWSAPQAEERRRKEDEARHRDEEDRRRQEEEDRRRREEEDRRKEEEAAARLGETWGRG